MKAIENFVDAMMSALPRTPETEELRSSLLEHAQDKFEALCAEGLNEYEALGRVVAEFGSAEELRAGLGIPEAAFTPGDSDPELSDLLLEYNLFRPKRRAATAAAAVLFILAPFTAPFAAISDQFWLAPLLFALCAGLGVGLLLYFSGRARDYRERIRERRAQLGLPEIPPASGLPFPDEQKSRLSRRRIRHMLNASLPIWVVLIYLYLGFAFHLWHPAWLIFFAIPLYYTMANGDMGMPK